MIDLSSMMSDVYRVRLEKSDSILSGENTCYLVNEKFIITVNMDKILQFSGKGNYVRTLTIVLMFFLFCSCSKQNEVTIRLATNTIVIGDVILARLYVTHNDSVAPTFYVIDKLDTVRLPADYDDNNCGIYRAAYTIPGEKVVTGFVDFLDKRNRSRTSYYNFKYTVLDLPGIFPTAK